MGEFPTSAGRVERPYFFMEDLKQLLMLHLSLLSVGQCYPGNCRVQRCRDVSVEVQACGPNLTSTFPSRLPKPGMFGVVLGATTKEFLHHLVTMLGFELLGFEPGLRECSGGGVMPLTDYCFFFYFCG